MQDQRGYVIETIDAEASAVILDTGEIITGNVCDRLLGAAHLADTCVDHYKPWL